MRSISLGMFHYILQPRYFALKIKEFPMWKHKLLPKLDLLLLDQKKQRCSLSPPVTSHWGENVWQQLIDTSGWSSFSLPQMPNTEHQHRQQIAEKWHYQQRQDYSIILLISLNSKITSVSFKTKCHFRKIYLRHWASFRCSSEATKVE